MTSSFANIKYAVRLLRKSPGFTAIAVATLALGIGANTVIFSAVESFLLRPLPLKEPDRLVFVRQTSKAGDPTPASHPDYLDWKQNVQAFERMGALHIDVFNLTGLGEPRRVRGSRFDADVFPVLAVPPLLGRTFSPGDDRPGAAPVIVLSHSFWQAEFGASRNVLGKTVVLDGRPREVIGVMPPELRFPGGFCDVWIPLAADAGDASRGSRYLAVIGRLAPGASLADARSQTGAVSKRLEAAYPETNRELSVVITPLHELLNRGPKRALLILFVAVTLVLLICCANLANMMLARAMHRHREIAIRMAVGAGRWQLLRQLLAESVVLSAMGGLLGLLLASWGVELLRTMLPPYLQPMGGLSLNTHVLEFCAALSVLTGILFGLAPAARLLRPQTVDALRDGGRFGSGPTRRSLTSGILVVAEIALASLLLVGAGLLLGWMRRMHDSDLGYDPRPVLTAEVVTKSEKYRDPASRWMAIDGVLRRLNAAPGVVAASAVNWPPMTNETTKPYAIEGQKQDGGSRPASAGYRVATAKYAEVMSIPVIAGRFVSDDDRANTEPVVVVNDLFARRAWPGQNPIGKRLALYEDSGKLAAWRTVVGVVGNLRHAGPAAAPKPELYLPFAQQGENTLYLALRTNGDPATLSRMLESVVKQVDPELPLALVRPMERVIADGLAPAKFTTNLLSAFSVCALLLASLGLYGVMSYLVARRVHEFGIRMALGATHSDLLRLVLRRSLLLTGIGTALGLVAGAAVSRVLGTIFDGMIADPAVFAAVALLLTATAALSAWMPLRRAILLGPLNTLRES
jgi:putative ABC transport system permease protein